MRWSRKGKEQLEQERFYRNTPFWFAWYPVTAADADGGTVRVWWEYVKVTKTPVHYHDRYGFCCNEVEYTYETTPQPKIDMA